MKKAIFILAGALLCALSCHPYDDTELKEILQEHEIRLQKLEILCEQTNSNISSMAKILQTLEENDYLTETNPFSTAEGTGYELVFNKAGKITIYDGIDGQDGKDASCPVVSARQDIDGIWYWTLNGKYLLNEGEKVRASAKNGLNGTDGADGAQGAQGTTPRLKIEDNQWYIQYSPDSAWLPAGSAAGQDASDGQDSHGETGQPGPQGPQGQQGQQGKPGRSFFEQIDITNGNCTLTLAGGQSITIPIIEKMTVSTDPAQCLVSGPGEEVIITYIILHPEPGTEASLFTTNGWTARIVSSSTEGGKLAITSPDPVTAGEVTLLIGNGKSNTVMVNIPCGPETL